MGTKGIDLEYVCATAIVIRIDQDFEVVVQVLAYVPPEFGRDDPRGHRVIAMNAEVYGVARVENAYFCLLGCWFTFIRLPLAKISNDFRRLPERIVQRPVELRSVIHSNGFRDS